MQKWSHKLRRSGYPATVRPEVIKAACEKWDSMCKDEDSSLAKGVEGEREEKGEGVEGNKLAQESGEPGVCPSNPGSNNRKPD